MSRIDAIVFDLGGVLVDWNPEYVYKTIFDKEEDMRWFFKNITTGDWNGGTGCRPVTGRWYGDIGESNFRIMKANIRGYYDRWERNAGWTHPGKLSISSIT